MSALGHSGHSKIPGFHIEVIKWAQAEFPESSADRCFVVDLKLEPHRTHVLGWSERQIGIDVEDADP